MTTEPNPIRVLVITAVRLYRDGLSGVLARSGFSVVGEHADGNAAMAHLEELAPDVILLDMTHRPGYVQMRELVQNAQNIPVVSVGVGDSELEIVACAEAGITGYLTHNASCDELREVVKAAARGEVNCSPQLAAALVRRLAALAAGHQPEVTAPELTRRERQVARLIEQDLTNKEIATRLGIEVATVKNHVHNLLAKLSVRRRGEAAGRLGRALRSSITADAHGH
jgi:two-component system, NarL family, nitrate/nitrite response regulator NarL